MKQKLADIILCLLFPPRCAVCRTAGADILCEGCLKQIVMINKPEGYVYCIGAYTGVMEKAIKRMKFHGKKRLAEPLGRIMAYHNPFIYADGIIPVPLHAKRLKERGFNQSELISSALARELDAPLILDTLVRRTDTKHLFDLGRTDRQKAVKGAFEVTNPSVVKGTHLILTDDVYTTGATTSECRKTLLGAGALSVKVLVLSRALCRMI